MDKEMAMNKEMTVSICMIVRNEEELLPIALASTEGLADEIVIVDTGSEDNTIEVARQLGAHVIEGGDRMHKGVARNQAMDASTGDWIVALDADEQIANPVGLREFLQTTDAQGIYAPEVRFNSKGKITLTHSRMRCWRRDAFRYKYRCHEVPLPTNGWGKTVYTNFIWEHRPPPERAGWKSNYSLNRLLLDVEENPGAPRPLYYLGRQYMYRKEWQKSIEILHHYLDTTGNQDRANAYGCLAKCYAGQKNQFEQIKSLYQALAHQPQRREWWGELATIYHTKGQNIIAVALLKAALELPPPARDYVQHYWYGSAIYDLLARCLWKLERHEEGKFYAEKALSLSPSDSRLQDNLRWFVESRQIQLKRVAPELFNKSGTLLYVGAHQLREPECLQLLRRAGYKISLLEIWPDNVNHFRTSGQFDHIIQGDIREIEKLALSHYDAILWWHGPEHIDLKDLPSTLVQLESLTDIVILGCPWGIMKQSPVYGNPHEEHRTHLQPKDFPADYNTDTIGKKNTRNGHLIAWKRINNDNCR